MSLIFTCCLIYNYFFRHRYFKVIETTGSRIIRGAKQAQSFITCRIKLMTRLAASELVFDELWIEDRLYKIRVTNEENQEVENQFSKKQVLYIDIDSEVHHSHGRVPPSEKSKSKIFLGYIVENKRRYFPINVLTEDLPQYLVA